jgi:Fe-S cluster assembly protein SufD
LASRSGAAAPATPARGSSPEPDWLSELRASAQLRHEAIPLPVQKDKGWEFTDLTTFDPESFAPAAGGDLEARPSRAPVVETGDNPWVLAVDGSVRHALDSGETTVTTIEQAARERAELVQPYLGGLVFDRDKFAAENSSRWTGGAFVHVPAGTRAEQPVVITAMQAAGGQRMSWRSLIVVEPGAELTVVEQYLSAEEDLEAYFNPVTELFVGEGAKLNYLCVQDLSERTWVLGSQRAQVGRDASLHWVGLGLGSGQGKLRMETDITGRGASARVTGGYVGHGTQHLDYDTTQEHAAPDTTSDLAFRGILRDRATAVWSGMIKVDHGAQRTDAFQENRNLILSEGAHADAIPGLEIEANDVRCTHAATVGRIDAGQVFYLMSRGLSRAEAERLLVGGFLEVIAGRLEDSPFLHEAVSAALERELERVLE